VLEDKVNQEKNTMRTGYTTGTCAAAGACAAAYFLENRALQSSVKIDLPEGGIIEIPVYSVTGNSSWAEAMIQKDSGDDPDITNCVIVITRIAYSSANEYRFFAGDGVGIVSKKGLSIPQGEPAINPVPRKMIIQSIRKISKKPVDITISIPGGRQLAERTFNPRLGVVGGLSILGTTGIVRPFSHKAVQDTILCALNIADATGCKTLHLVPGNIGRNAAMRLFAPPSATVVEVSNEWGFTLLQLSKFSFYNIIITGHPGKLVKLAECKWDTHSSQSSSAFKYVKNVIENSIPGCTFSDTSTVEGLLQMLPDISIRKAVSDKLSNHIALSISNKGNIRGTCTVVLIDMQGNEYGRSTRL
jgi:cobalt-precorrin-5B (C1)-methyltransferase